MIYLAQVSICWLLFYTIYVLFLRKETFFIVNRYYLIGALVTGLIIPIAGGLLPANEASTDFYAVMTSVVVSSQEFDTQSSFVMSWSLIFWMIYVLGALVVLSRTIHGLVRIFNIYKSGKTTHKEGYTLVESEVKHLPFSFFQYVFVSKNIALRKDVKQIILHEQIHVNQWHSLDILFTEVLQVFFWFNPVLIQFKKALRQAHEYLADAYVSDSWEKVKYSRLLLEHTPSGLEFALANQFFNSQIKKRINMIHSKRSTKSAIVKYLAAIPVLAILLMIFSSNISLTSTPFDRDEVILEISQYFENPILDTDGITDFIHELEDKYSSDKAELAAIFSEMSPIKGYSIDISNTGKTCLFWSDDKSVGAETPEQINTTTPPQSNKANPLVVMNNKVAGQGNHHIEAITPDQVKHVNVLKGDAATTKYGKRASDGAVEITLKKDTLPLNHDEIYKVAQDMPRFPGCEHIDGTAKEKEECGKKKMLEYIYSKVKYPKQAREKGIDGMTVIQYVIAKDGSINNAKIVRDIGGGCGKEALRVVNSMPDWIPGVRQGKIVNVLYTLPVRFKLADESDNETDEGSNDNKFEIPEVKGESQKETFKIVDVMPRFPGCEHLDQSAKEKEKCSKGEMLRYIYSNISYPKDAREKGLEGTVVISMIINSVGQVENAEVVRSVNDDFDEVSLRVINSMPTWVPGESRGEKVDVKYTVPIRFRLESSKKKK